MELNFQSRRILVTGAGRGIGREVCRALAKGNATVFALSQTQEHLDSLKKEFPTITTLTVNLSNWDETRSAVESVLPIDGLVNNAGIAMHNSFLEVTPEEIDQTFGINVKAVINVSQIVAKSMKDSGTGGSIVNLSSVASLVAMAKRTVYGGSKSALDQISKVMALELGPFNIRVNCVNPTVVMTDMGKANWSDPVRAKELKDKIPMHKFAELEDVVHPILFLLSNKSDMINGIKLPVDGGLFAT